MEVRRKEKEKEENMYTEEVGQRSKSERDDSPVTRRHGALRKLSSSSSEDEAVMPKKKKEKVFCSTCKISFKVFF